MGISNRDVVFGIIAVRMFLRICHRQARQLYVVRLV